MWIKQVSAETMIQDFATQFQTGFNLGPIALNSQTILWAFFGVVVLIYIVVSLVLVYHWRRYSLRNRRIAFAETVYFFVSISVLVVALFALILS